MPIALSYEWDLVISSTVSAVISTISAVIFSESMLWSQNLCCDFLHSLCCDLHNLCCDFPHSLCCDFPPQSMLWSPQNLWCDLPHSLCCDLLHSLCCDLLRIYAVISPTVYIVITSIIYAVLLIGLILCRSCMGDHSCEFMNVTAMPCSEENISQYPSPSSGSHIFPDLSLFPGIWWWRGDKDALFETKCSPSLTLSTLISYFTIFINCCLLPKETTLIKVKSGTNIWVYVNRDSSFISKMPRPE